MKADGAKEKLMRAFDQTQTRFEELCAAQLLHRKTSEQLAHAAEMYQAAKKNWENTLKTCSPGNETTPATPCTSGENTPTGSET